MKRIKNKRRRNLKKERAIKLVIGLIVILSLALLVWKLPVARLMAATIVGLTIVGIAVNKALTFPKTEKFFEPINALMEDLVYEMGYRPISENYEQARNAVISGIYIALVTIAIMLAKGYSIWHSCILIPVVLFLSVCAISLGKVANKQKKEEQEEASDQNNKSWLMLFEGTVRVQLKRDQRDYYREPKRFLDRKWLDICKKYIESNNKGALYVTYNARQEWLYLSWKTESKEGKATILPEILKEYFKISG